MSRDDDLDLLLDDDDSSHHNPNHDAENDSDHDVYGGGSGKVLDLDELDDETEAEEQRARTNKGGRSVPSTDEEEEEEEEDGDDEPTPKGKGVNPFIMVGAAFSVISLAAVGGYVVLNKDNGAGDQPMVKTSMPAPSIEDLGKDVNVPSTNFAASDIDNALGGQAEGGLGQASPTAPVAEVQPLAVASKVDDVKLSAPQVSAPVATIVAPPPAAAAVVAASADDVAPTAPVTAQAPIVVASVEKEPEPVAKVVQERQNDDLGDRIDNLQKTVEKLAVAKSVPEVDVGQVRSKIIEELRVAKEAKAQAKAEQQRVAIDQAITGKQRIPGFQVINATSDGTISIIKAPSGRTFALFKGERFKSNTGAVLEVKSIISDGKLVVAGDNWFIDETLVFAPKVPVQAKKKIESQPSSRQDSSQVSEAKKPKPAGMNGWGMHATFEGGGYLLKKPDGEYITVQKGESYPETGRVTGIDGSGNLVTEKGTIKGEM
ncbi:hypothetical protein RYA05_04870 [Pseudomonas syringae pv. actinidiae]|nr:hypothetical protein [Pseudomonas syringae pv. actinidiae]